MGFWTKPTGRREFSCDSQNLYRIAVSYSGLFMTKYLNVISQNADTWYYKTSYQDNDSFCKRDIHFTLRKHYSWETNLFSAQNWAHWWILLPTDIPIFPWLLRHMFSQRMTGNGQTIILHFTNLSTCQFGVSSEENLEKKNTFFQENPTSLYQVVTWQNLQLVEPSTDDAMISTRRQETETDTTGEDEQILHKSVRLDRASYTKFCNQMGPCLCKATATDASALCPQVIQARTQSRRAKSKDSLKKPVSCHVGWHPGHITTQTASIFLEDEMKILFHDPDKLCNDRITCAARSRNLARTMN